MGRGRQSHQIGHPVQGNSGGEPFSGGQSVEGGQTPGTSAPNTHTGAVDAARDGQVTGGVNAVLGVGHAPLPPERAAIVPPVAGAAGVVHPGHGKTPAGEVLHGDVEPAPPPTTSAHRDRRRSGGRGSPSGPAVSASFGGYSTPWTGRPERPTKSNDSPTDTLAGAERDVPTGSERARRPPRRRQHPHVVGTVGRSADVRHAVTVPAQRADGDARLGDHLRGRLRGR